MSVLWKPHPQFDHVALCDGPEGLVAIREPHINLVIWQDATTPEVRKEAESMYLPTGGWEGALTRIHRDNLPFSKDIVRVCVERIALAALQANDSSDGSMDFQYNDPTDHRPWCLHGDPRMHCIVPLVGAVTQWAPNDVVPKDQPHPKVPDGVTQDLPVGCAALFKGVDSGLPLYHRPPSRFSERRVLAIIQPWA